MKKVLKKLGYITGIVALIYVVCFISMLTLTNCTTTKMEDSYSNDNTTLYKNSDPKIEDMHVKAYNYDLGIGVKQDRVKANELYLICAKAGDARSMMNYAVNRFDGLGVKPDQKDAFEWIDKARYLTQNSKDIKLKWRIRAVYNDMKDKLKK